ncbi:MAG TPA: hypothetical protein VFM14_01265 [Gemmatimonadales bacterium]|nr:hypothetical protein [Gemmatimonadales bacterium]
MTRHTRDVVIAAQDYVEREGLTEVDQCRPDVGRRWSAVMPRPAVSRRTSATSAELSVTASDGP